MEKVKPAEKQLVKTAKAKRVAAPGKAESPNGGLTRNDRILKAMEADPDQTWTAGQVAQILADKRRLIQAMMSGLAKSGRIMKVERGYRLPTLKVVA